MNHFFKRSIHFFAVSFFTLIIVLSCDKDMSVMLDNSATSNVGVTMIDSFTVNTSTVQLSDMPSIYTGVVLVGKATVPYSGVIESSSYFRIGFSTLTNDIPEAATFDSLNLVLKPTYNRYYFGDTTIAQTIHVHQLTEALASKTPTPRYPNQPLPIYVTGASIFSDQTFAYNSSTIGTATFRPRIKSMDTLNIRLDDNIGQDFFDKVKKGDIRVTSNNNFQEYFKGLVLTPDGNNTTILGFSDTLQVKLNYSYYGTDGHKQIGFKELKIVDPNYQYNNIRTDRTGTAFESLSSTNALSTTATGGLTYVQAGSGTVAKISLPSLKEFLQNENMAINKAELVIETSSKTTGMYAIPSSLILFVADQDGVPISFLQNSYGTGMQQAAFVAGREFGQNGTYTFNVMAYLQTLKTTTTYDNTSFYLSAASLDLFSTFNTAFIELENAKPKIKLNILYTKFR